MKPPKPVLLRGFATLTSNGPPSSARSACCLNMSHPRHFTTTTPRRAAMGALQSPGSVMKMMPKEKSTKSRLKKLKSTEIPTDVGLLPMTFISPPARELAPMLAADRKRLFRVLWLRFKHTFLGFWMNVYQLKFTSRKDSVTGQKLKSPPLLLRQRTEIARNLHQTFYTALAAGDIAAIERMACNGLRGRMKIRLHERKASRLPEEKWTLVKYNGIVPPTWLPWVFASFLPYKAIKVMTDKLQPLPFGKDSSLRQVVVRISSRQSLDKGDGKGLKTADVTEYVVVQKLVLEGQKDTEWMIWGTLTPSTEEEIDDLLDSDSAAQSTSFAERMRSQFSGLMGG